jgi:DNA-3-methyladenine glycosylase II
MLPLRSSARLAAQASSSAALGNTNASRAVEMKTPTRRRKPETTLTKENVKRVHRETTVPVVGQPDNSAAYGDEDVPAVLTFDFELAKKHLIAVDHRFENIFDEMRCKPFEELERVHPFRYEKVLNCCKFQG